MPSTASLMPVLVLARRRPTSRSLARYLLSHAEANTSTSPAGLAVLSGIAASDAICGARLGHLHRGDDHKAAQEMLRKATPDGDNLATQLGRLLSLKDAAHYGVQVISSRNATDATR
jgi:hypothetical protein